MEIRRANFQDKEQITTLYKRVALVADGIIRHPNEIDDTYISYFLQSSINNGLILVAVIENQIVSEIHAVTPNLFAFQHLLTDLTIVVDPNRQGQGIGRKLFMKFLEVVKTEFPKILRVELFTREHNNRNVQFYKSLGFVDEGRQERKIFLAENNFHTPIHMAWFNPSYRNSS
jgi:putative acetyltransferase